MSTFINYSKAFPNAMVASGSGTNFLLLEKLDNPTKRMDGRMGQYQLTYRWLSTECKDGDDQAWACVQGDDWIYLTEKDVKEVKAKLSSDPESVSLFDFFNLF